MQARNLLHIVDYCMDISLAADKVVESIANSSQTLTPDDVLSATRFIRDLVTAIDKAVANEQGNQEGASSE